MELLIVVLILVALLICAPDIFGAVFVIFLNLLQLAFYVAILALILFVAVALLA